MRSLKQIDTLLTVRNKFFKGVVVLTIFLIRFLAFASYLILDELA